MKKYKNKGISVIEILIVVSIIAVISAIIIPGFSEFRNQQELKNTTEDVLSLLNEARNNTISSKNSTTYGVHFESDKAVLFQGIYVFNSPSNKQINFDSPIAIPLSGGINLSGGGSDVLFSRITGDTEQDGNIVIRATNDVTKQKVITINKVGVISTN